MLDSLAYLKAARAGDAGGGEVVATKQVAPAASMPGATPRDDILDLAKADLSVVRLSRRDNDNRTGQVGRRRIPPEDIVAIGGTNLEPRTADQPFRDASDAANDNLGRVLLLVALLVAVIGGYALTAFGHDTRRAIEVVPPESPAIRIT